MSAHVVTSLARDDLLWRVDEDRTLSHPAKRVYGVLHRTAVAIGSSELAVTAAAIAERIGASDPRTARRALDELADQELVHVGDRDRRRGMFLVTVFGAYPGKAEPFPDAQKRFDFDAADKPAQACPPDGQECSDADKLAQACPPKSEGGPGSQPTRAHAHARRTLSVCQSSTTTEGIDWGAAVALYERASRSLANEVLPVRSELGRLVLKLAGLTVQDPSLLLEAVAAVRRRGPDRPATYLRAVVGNMAWERAHGHEPEDGAEKAQARSWLRQHLAAIDAEVPPAAELRRLAGERGG